MRKVQLREMLGTKVHDPDGVPIGHLEEVEVERGETECVVTAYIVEHRGLLDRVSSWALTSGMQKALERRSQNRPYRIPWDQMDMSDPRHPVSLIPKSDLPHVGEDPLSSLS